MTARRDTSPVIAYVLADASVGGGPTHLIHLLEGLDRTRFSPVVIVSPNGREFSANVRSLGYPIHNVDMFRARADPTALLQLAGLFGRIGPECIHLHGTRSGLYGVLAARIAGCRSPIVYTAHGLACHRGIPWARWRMGLAVERLIGRVADVVISVSSSDRRSMETLGIARGKAVTILNGIRVDEVPLASRSDARSALGAAPGEFLVGAVARLVPQKGLDVFVRAAAVIASRHPAARFLIVGDGPLRKSLEGLADGLGVSSRISFLGSSQEVSGILSALDLFVLSSRWEGLPLVVLEAMRAQVPIVASGVDGVVDAICHGETGWLVPPDDPIALAEAISGAIGDPEGVRRVVGRAFTDLQRRFDVSRMVDQTQGVYDRVLW